MKSRKLGGFWWGVLVEHAFPVLLFAAVVAIFLNGLSSAVAGSAEEERRVAEESIRRAVISCYAIEGRYPASFDYLKENFGIRVDERKFRVEYDIFASNIMPDITVLELASGLGIRGTRP
ncbi:MAG: hypothetical protein LBK98_10400 [Peptococcaceae bacterium]|jgi:hypothetical protein|nr:hypothetical protein [Peptococcaceae bacterium]